MRRSILIPGLATAAVCALATVSLRAQVITKKAAGGAMMKMEAGPTKAVVALRATKIGGEASGEVTFTKVEDGIHVVGEIRGLTPGAHGFHIHEFGDVSSPDAMSAGGHFNPGKSEHGAPMDGKRHAGDLGNIEASARGVAKIDVVDAKLSLSGPGSIIGRGVIVHEKADDFKTQPTGAAGGRVAAGVIGVGKAG